MYKEQTFEKMDKKHRINFSLSINGGIINDNHKKAELFNDHFIKKTALTTKIYVSLIFLVFVILAYRLKLLKTSFLNAKYFKCK